MKYFVWILLGIITCSFLCGCGVINENEKKEYVVLIGEDSEITGKISNVHTLVIDADYFDKKDIEALKCNGVEEIYSYLNVGSVEEFRCYYNSYVNLTLEDYDNWPGEKWIDVSKLEWQKFITSRAEELSEKGIDGFFVDNLDVYYMYPEEEIYEGIVCILQCIQETGKKGIINGGDCFVKKYFETVKSGPFLFSGVNQENVYTYYDFETGKMGESSKTDRDYYTEYLNLIKSKGLTAYVLEYSDSRIVSDKAGKYSSDCGYIYYCSDNIELKMNK